MRTQVAIIIVLLGAMVVDGVNQWRFVRAGGAFRCKIRATGERPLSWPRLRRRWSRRMWARWVDSALVVRRGPILARSVTMPARVCQNGVYTVPPWDPKRCGRQPLAVELVVPDFTRVEVAAPEAARLNLVGPYLAAAIHELPRAPNPRRQIRGPGGA
jgi:hypothetical protein